MKKALLCMLLLLALCAFPLIAQDDPKPDVPKKLTDAEKKAEADAKAEEALWQENEELVKKFRAAKTRAEQMKIAQLIYPKQLEYAEKFFGVNKERTLQVLPTAIYYMTRYGKTDKFLELSAKWLKSDILDAKTRANLSGQRIELLIKEKPEKALEEVNKMEIKEAKEGEKLTPEDLIHNANIYTLKARIYLSLKKDKLFAEVEKKLHDIRANSTDEKVKQYTRYYIMKINAEKIVPGVVAPEWKAKDFEGNEVKLSDIKDKVILLDFWATWCGPCRYAMENHLKPLWAKYKNSKDFVIISIGSGSKSETLEKEKAFVEKMGYNWTFLFDAVGDAGMAYGATGIPKLVLIDKAGKIVKIGHGGIMEDVVKFVEKNCTVGEEPKEEPKVAPKKEEPKKDKPEEEF